jgi:hypothetical protein
MPNACYFRQQADMCARLALVASDRDVAQRFALMAHDYLAKAEAAEQAQARSAMADAGGSPGLPKSNKAG